MLFSNKAVAAIALVASALSSTEARKNGKSTSTIVDPCTCEKEYIYVPTLLPFGAHQLAASQMENCFLATFSNAAEMALAFATLPPTLDEFVWIGLVFNGAVGGVEQWTWLDTCNTPGIDENSPLFSPGQGNDGPDDPFGVLRDPIAPSPGLLSSADAAMMRGAVYECCAAESSTSKSKTGKTGKSKMGKTGKSSKSKSKSKSRRRTLGMARG